jgi:hypothetical protein
MLLSLPSWVAIPAPAPTNRRGYMFYAHMLDRLLDSVFTGTYLRAPESKVRMALHSSWPYQVESQSHIQLV